MTPTRALVGIAGTLAVAALVALAGSQGSVRFGGLPLFALCGLLSFLLHWVAFVPSYLYRTEHYFDLTGSITCLSVVVFAVTGSPDRNLRSLLIALLVAIWTIRLGSFLFLRIKRAGKDDRFDEIKKSFLAFLMTWTLSGLWVFLTMAAGLAAITATQRKALDGWALVGALIWVIGWGIEVVADSQKSRFRSRPENRSKFISEGLWAWSRHPNYFGEITLWFGIALIAFPVLSGWQLVTLVSPLFVWFLLTKGSGIPLLEAKAEEKWGDDPEYQAYRDSTPRLFPRPPG